MKTQSFQHVAVIRCFALLAMSCIGCKPTPGESSSSSGGSSGISSSSSSGSSSSGVIVDRRSPGRPGAVLDVVKNATRVRSPGFKSGPRPGPSPSTIEQGLNGEDGGRSLNVDFTGANLSFTDLYFAMPPLTEYVTTTDDAGVVNTETTYPFPPVIVKIATNGTASEFYAFPTTTEELDRFRSGFGGAVSHDGGPELYEPRNLVLTTAVDPAGNIYLSSNSSLEILKFTPAGERSSFITLEAPVSDIKISSGFMYASLLPKIDTTFTALLQPPKLAKIDMATQAIDIIASLPADFALYQQNARGFNGTDADGGFGTQFYAPTSIIFALNIGNDGTVYMSSGKESKVYRLDPDAGMIEYATSLEGITSLSGSPVNDCMYATLPAITKSTWDEDAGTTLWGYERYPKIVSICPGKGVADFLALDSYAGIDPLASQNGFGYMVGTDRYIGIAAVSTIASDSNGNLVLADPVRSIITAIQVVPIIPDAGVAIDLDAGATD